MGKESGQRTGRIERLGAHGLTENRRVWWVTDTDRWAPNRRATKYAKEEGLFGEGPGQVQYREGDFMVGPSALLP